MPSVYGPFVKNVRTSSRVDYTIGYKTSGKPRPNTNFFADRVIATGFWNQVNGQNMNGDVINKASALQAATYDKFWNKVHARANVGISAFEGKKSFAMVAARSLQLVRALKAVDAGRVKDAWRHLSVDLSASNRARPNIRRELSTNWLEYTFGWVPLIQDIYSACQVLQQDFDVFRGAASSTMPYYYNFDDGGSRFSVAYSCKYYYRAKVRVTNPNLLLANQLGVLNPAHIAWDAVPFSFVVDWFVPVGKFVQSWTNGVGLELISPFYGVACRGNGAGWHISDGATSFLNKTGSRVNGVIPPPGLLSRVRLPNVDPWLAVTSLSLLTQALSSYGDKRH